MKIVQDEQLPIRQSYTRTLEKLSIDQRLRNHPRNKSKARKADKKVKMIAGRLVRELERNLSPDSVHQKTILFFKQVLAQTRGSKNKIYSLHEPDALCISKGKEHRKYEFGNKVSIVKTQNTGVIVGAMGILYALLWSKLAAFLEKNPKRRPLTGVTEGTHKSVPPKSRSQTLQR